LKAKLFISLFRGEYMKRDYVTGFFALIGTFMILYILLPLVVIVSKQLFDWEMLMRTLKDELVLIALRNSLLTSTDRKSVV